jgi:hypothetical protein
MPRALPLQSVRPAHFLLLLLCLNVFLTLYNLSLAVSPRPQSIARRGEQPRLSHERASPPNEDVKFSDLLLSASSGSAKTVAELTARSNALADRVNALAEQLQRVQHERRELKMRVEAFGLNSPNSIPPVTSQSEKESEQPWLIVGIPTVPRRLDNAEHVEQSLLFRTLRSYVDQLEAAVPRSPVTIVVMNNRPGQHPIFERVKQRLQAASQWIRFMDRPDELPDTDMPMDPEFSRNHHEPPSPQVRRQTLDIISLLRVVEGRSKYFLFAEDDFELCDNGMMALSYMVSRAEFYQGPGAFTAVRCGIGLNGVVMHNNGDVGRFRHYLERHFARRPPDHLVVEFYAKESQEAKEYFGPQRRVMAFRHNIFLHTGGEQSTLREQSAWSTPGCFTELIAPQVFVVEAWNPVDCPLDDIWPCHFPRSRPSSLSWNSSSEAAVSRNRLIYVGRD